MRREVVVGVGLAGIVSLIGYWLPADRDESHGDLPGRAGPPIRTPRLITQAAAPPTLTALAQLETPDENRLAAAGPTLGEKFANESRSEATEARVTPYLDRVFKDLDLHDPSNFSWAEPEATQFLRFRSTRSSATGESASSSHMRMAGSSLFTKRIRKASRCSAGRSLAAERF